MKKMYVEAFFSLRRWVYDLHRKYHRRKRKLVPIPYRDGLPVGIDQDTLNTICQENFGASVSTVSHQHLSGWKAAGAYRLVVKTQGGQEVNLIFKDANYARDQIPALQDLPVFPGPPEYVVYSQCCGPMTNYLPRIYLAKEIDSGRHYQYLLEDLSQNYHHLLEYNDTRRAARLLPRLHEALREWTVETMTNASGLIHYGRDFSLSIQEYSRANLEGYSQRTDDADLKEVLRIWPQIARMHLLPEFFTIPSTSLIHGDANYTNIHLHKTDLHQFKVVDWEWAGFGIPHADLASLLKSAPEDIERSGFRGYMQTRQAHHPALDRDLTAKQHRRQYLWAHLERGMLDAGFLAGQFLNTSHLSKFSMPKAITQSLQRILSAYQQLSN